MESNRMENEAMNPNEHNYNNKTNTFNLIIGIATLLIAILGATFAYFSATARSAENDVTVKSAYVSISYDGGTEIKASNLIPATQQVALTKFQKTVEQYNPEVDGEIDTEYDTYANDINRRCVDAKGKEVCYVYQFSVKSDGAVGEETEILASITVNKNEFVNLSYVLYEVTFQTDENGTVLTDKYGFGLVDTYSVVSQFTQQDKNPDNQDFTNVFFEKFGTPQPEYGENGELINTMKPVACLFGHSEDAAEKALDDTSRCLPHNITNKQKHTYQLVIWLEETGQPQDEQGKTFEGTVTVEVSGGMDIGDYENGEITGQQ